MVLSFYYEGLGNWNSCRLLSPTASALAGWSRPSCFYFFLRKLTVPNMKDALLKWRKWTQLLQTFSERPVRRKPFPGQGLGCSLLLNITRSAERSAAGRIPLLSLHVSSWVPTFYLAPNYFSHCHFLKNPGVSQVN